MGHEDVYRYYNDEDTCMHAHASCIQFHNENSNDHTTFTKLTGIPLEGEVCQLCNQQ